MARTAQVFKGYLGDRSSIAEFDYGDLSWQADPDHPGGINSEGGTRKDEKKQGYANKNEKTQKDLFNR